ncbi:MAG: DUF4112 domain-containing protein [Myxococcota bacterium]
MNENSSAPSTNTPGNPGGEKQRARRLGRLRSLSTLLDNAVRIPGTNYRVGLDPLIGLIPGGGDVVGGLLSMYIVLEAARMGVPRAKLGRMGANVLWELGIGTVPIIGDVFDVTWKANARNVALLEEHLESDVADQRASPWLVAAIVAVIVAAVAGTTMLSIWLIRQAFELGWS